MSCVRLSGSPEAFAPAFPGGGRIIPRLARKRRTAQDASSVLMRPMTLSIRSPACWLICSSCLARSRSRRSSSSSSALIRFSSATSCSSWALVRDLDALRRVPPDAAACVSPCPRSADLAPVRACALDPLLGLLTTHRDFEPHFSLETLTRVPRITIGSRLESRQACRRAAGPARRRQIRPARGSAATCSLN